MRMRGVMEFGRSRWRWGSQRAEAPDLADRLATSARRRLGALTWTLRQLEFDA